MRNCSTIWLDEWIPVYGFKRATCRFQHILEATTSDEKSVREIAIKSLQEEYGNCQGTF